MRKSNGFTLIEMMIVIAIIALIAGYGVPQFNSMMQNGRLSTQVNELQGLMQLARHLLLRAPSRSPLRRSGEVVRGQVLHLEPPRSCGLKGGGRCGNRGAARRTCRL